MVISFLKFLIFILADVASLVMAIVIQKVVFLESHTKEQFMTSLKILLCMIGIIFCLYMLPPALEERLFGSTYFTPIMVVCLTFVPFFYCAYTGRKRYKWLAFFEFIPILGCIDGVYGLYELFLTKVPAGYIHDFITFAPNLAIVLLFGYLAWKQPPFVRYLIKDIRQRTLTIGEEVVVWLVGIWLFVCSTLLEDQLINATSFNIALYVCTLNCVCAAVIIAYVINSNYRDFYYKKNEHLQKSLIAAMAELVENRDENTGGHIQRTSHYVQIIARRLKSEGKLLHESSSSRESLPISSQISILRIW